MIWTNLIILVLFFAKATCAETVDHLALLLGTLRTYQRTGCDKDIMTLKCPHTTSISVQSTHYGELPADQRICVSANPPRNSSCLQPHDVRIVVEACQKKQQCRFHANPKTATSNDPCPGVTKLGQVRYKCRPYVFRSKVACENEVVELQCNPNSRIAVYSASFGRTKYESVHCPQPQGVRDETCLASYATETVMHICHGKRRCTISADASTFGKPCQPSSRMYLKIVYTCVPRKVVLETIVEPTLDDETIIGASRDANEYNQLDGYDMDDVFHESAAAFSPAPDLDSGVLFNTTTPTAEDQTSVISMNKVFTVKTGGRPSLEQDSKQLPSDEVNCTVTVYTSTTPRVLGFLTEWIKTYAFLKKNQEKMYLYLVVSLTSAMLVFLAIVVARLIVHKYRAVRQVKMYSTHHDHTIPQEFGDENSEIDADITLATSPHIATLGSSTYRMAPSPTERAARTHQSAVDIVPFREATQVEAPRSLSRFGNNQYYFG